MIILFAHLAGNFFDVFFDFSLNSFSPSQSKNEPISVPPADNNNKQSNKYSYEFHHIDKI